MVTTDFVERRDYTGALEAAFRQMVVRGVSSDLIAQAQVAGLAAIVEHLD